MQIIYCSKWWLKKKKPIDIFNVEEAYKLHSKGELYSVVIMENNIVKYVLDISSNYLIVRFMNDYILPYLIYEFKVVDKENIFLKVVSYYEYYLEKEIESIVFNFQYTGEVVIEKVNLKNGEMEEKIAITDVKKNWGKYPSFGDYTSLLQEKR